MQGVPVMFGRCHDLLDPPPRGRTTPIPDPPIGRIWIALGTTYMKEVVEFAQHGVG